MANCGLTPSVRVTEPFWVFCAGPKVRPLAATSCGYYGMTPDANPLIGFDARIPNLLHAAGFSGHGIMHAPITATLVEALLAGDVRDGEMRLPAPFETRCIALEAFAPTRDFAAEHAETMVL